MNTPQTLTPLRIAVIAGSTRPGRRSLEIAQWACAELNTRAELQPDVLDLADHPLPLFAEPVPPMGGQISLESTRNWATTIEQYDGYVLITPEYNHSTSAVLKNALDHLYYQWNDKVVGFVSYGMDAAGARAVEHLRCIAGELKLADVRSAVTLSLPQVLQDGQLSPQLHHDQALSRMADELSSWGTALRQMRIGH